MGKPGINIESTATTYKISIPAEKNSIVLLIQARRTEKSARSPSKCIKPAPPAKNVTGRTRR